MYHILCFCKEKIGTLMGEIGKFVHYNEHFSTEGVGVGYFRITFDAF